MIAVVKKALVVLILMGMVVSGIFLIAQMLTDGSVRVVKEPDPVPAETKVVEESSTNLLSPERPNYVIPQGGRDGQKLLIEEAKLEKPGFVVAYDSQNVSKESLVGFSEFLPKGISNDETVYLIKDFDAGVVYFGIRFDDGDGFFEITGKSDANLVRADGKPILWEYPLE